MSTTDLADWLLTQIAEDERVARAASPGHWEQDSGWSITAPPPNRHWRGPNVVVETNQRNDAEFIARHDPARVLSECDAKRRIVEAHPIEYGNLSDFTDCATCLDVDTYDAFPCLTLRLLALLYADHQGYLPEWKP